ncbi:MAG: ribonuclease III [Clostridiales bacterium]|jgi:ribonuclease-3 family protein|nr:ribonuclease III [Clostridiales bacterium]
MTVSDANLKNVLALAFVGDGYLHAAVRAHLVATSDVLPQALHKRAAAVVSARAQAALADTLSARLTEAEHGIYMRARNASGGSHAKNANAALYRKATALEAVFGYLYLTENTERLAVLMQYVLQAPTTQGEE